MYPARCTTQSALYFGRHVHSGTTALLLLTNLTKTPRLNWHENIDPNVFFEMKTGKISRGRDFTLGWMLAVLFFLEDRK